MERSKTCGRWDPELNPIASGASDMINDDKKSNEVVSKWKCDGE
jgi:hypothetical protein